MLRKAFGYVLGMDTSPTPPPENEPASTNAIPTRRHMLALGAVGVSAAITIQPAFAQAAVSVMNCEIPVPDPARASQYIDASGQLVAPGTAGAFPGAGRAFTGEEVKRGFAGATLPGTSPDQSQAYLQYIRRLQAGQSGFTCFASIQMPR